MFYPQVMTIYKASENHTRFQQQLDQARLLHDQKRAMSSSTSSAPSYILTRLLRVDQALTEASRKSFGASARVYHAMQEIDQQSDRIIDRGQTLSRRDQEDRDAMLRSIEYAIDLEQNQAKAYDERKGIRQKWEQSLAATVMADHHRTLASHLDESQPSHWTVYVPGLGFFCC